jgi:hypothetical protein
MRRWVVLVTFLMIVGLGTGLVLGKTLASSRQAPSTTTATTMPQTTCYSTQPLLLCKTAVSR